LFQNKVAFQLSHPTSEEVLDCALETSKDRKSETHVKPDSHKAGAHTVVEAHDTVLGENLAEAVGESVVFV
jgi:hypothetical protein